MIDSAERLGARDFGGYPSIKQHQLFDSVDFETLYLMTPPRPSNCANTVGSNSSEADLADFQDATPGLGGQQLSRLLGLQLSDEPSTTDSAPPPPPSTKDVTTPASTIIQTPVKTKTIIQFPADEQQLKARLLHQQETIPQWHNLVDGQLILKQGLIDKKKVPL